MNNFILLFTVQLLAFYLFFDLTNPISVVTLAGKLLGLSILSLSTTIISMVLSKQKTYIILATTTLTVALILPLITIILPGYILTSYLKLSILILACSLFSVLIIFLINISEKRFKKEV